MHPYSPAHKALFSPFDTAIGHFRRYNRASLIAICPSGMQVKKTFYLDSMGMLLSLANRLALRQGNPTRSQIAFWDSVIVPISRILDFCTGYLLGKSVVAVYVK